MVYLEAVIQGFSLKQLFYIFLGNSRGGVHFQWSCRSLKYYIYLLCELLLFFYCVLLFYCVLFLGNCPQWLLHNFKCTFHFNLHGRKALWRALLAGGFLINIWYCISFLLNINSVSFSFDILTFSFILPFQLISF